MIRALLKYVLFSLMLVSSIHGVGQESYIDSLDNVLSQARSNNDDRLKVNTFIKMGDYYTSAGDYRKAYRHYNRARRRSKWNNFKKYRVQSIIKMGDAETKQSQFENALEEYKEGKKLADKFNLENLLALADKKIKNTKRKMKKLAKAQKSFEKFKGMSKKEAIDSINKQNREEEEQDERFLREIDSLSAENQTSKLRLRFKEDQVKKKELRNKLLEQNNKSQEAQLAKNRAELAQKKAETEKQQLFLWFSIGGVILLLFLMFFIVRGYRQKQKTNDLLMSKNTMISIKNKEITDSIKYAQKIQEAILKSSDKVNSDLPDNFILYKPKDIVSGDFYWIHSTKDGKAVWAVVDCTGHGVPGAFMSMIGNRLLNEIIIEKKIISAGEILNELKASIIKALNQDGKAGESKDGMDMALCIWDQNSDMVDYAGANNGLYLVRKNVANSKSFEKRTNVKFFENDLVELKPNRLPIGYNPYKNDPFESHQFKVQKGDTVYMFSDGFVDQFGGEKAKKFTTKRFKRLILSLQDQSMEEQKATLDKELTNWKGEQEQLDDICVMGIRF